MIKTMRRVLADPSTPAFAACLLVVNFLGSIYGFYWYRYQLAETPWFYLPFVPDSPLSSTLFTIVMFTILVRRRNSFLELWAYLWVIKYGIWAVVINLDYGLNYGRFAWENLMLSLSHFGMAAEGWIFLRHLKFRWRQYSALVIWLFINDYADYVLEQHPWLFAEGQINLARNLALALSLILAGVSLYYLKKTRQTYG